RDRLQGTWVPVSAEKGGKPAPEAVLTSVKVTFSGDRLTVQVEGETKKGTFRLDPTRSPKQIDLMRDGQEPTEGIYRLDRDRLGICLDDARRGRPTEFKSPPGPAHTLLVMRRDKAVRGGKEADDPARLKIRIQQLQEQLAQTREELQVAKRQLDEVRA